MRRGGGSPPPSQLAGLIRVSCHRGKLRQTKVPVQKQQTNEKTEKPEREPKNIETQPFGRPVAHPFRSLCANLWSTRWILHEYLPISNFPTSEVTQNWVESSVKSLGDFAEWRHNSLRMRASFVYNRESCMLERDSSKFFYARSKKTALVFWGHEG